MKKIITSTIISLIITFIFAEIFSIYDFGSIPTFRTILYLILLFSIFLFILLFIFNILIKIRRKEKIEVKDIIKGLLLLVSLILILIFVITLEVDWVHQYMNFSPFYVNVIIRILEFLLPAMLFIIFSVLLDKK